MRKTRLLVGLAAIGLILGAVVALSFVYSAPPSATPDLRNPQGASAILTEAPVRAAEISTAGALIFPTPPNSATMTAGSRPQPTCVSVAPAVLTAAPSLIPAPRYPNDPLPAMQSTSIASQIAGHSRYIPVRTTDLAPNVSAQDKWIVEVGYPDCTAERFLVATADINTFVPPPQSNGFIVTIFPPASQPRYPLPPSNRPPTSTPRPSTYPQPSPRP